ncbi:hypothetical protein MGYG_06086 [Nannizzia gypsea CBS 118893]|uniref:Myb-like domain-containing protein n=1 Tax=Arthroderma gypseum (strain ATCC MYA-4604 / CBS 118893) TaxID=535722 RepID=E4V0F4_ARTGP|nr:hypothetical protein MGYG_06086 [Nannizzia gypsea CBS 118893]EFR03091.1 hypothetical protein MGYG_06086 [Nannizzia gypsea CBS 118893]
MDRQVYTDGPPSPPSFLAEYKPSCLGAMRCGIEKQSKSLPSCGGRAWTEEEDAYLYRARMMKTPYKRIAAHLCKTELACRLHYHQMSSGNLRRRSAKSRSSSLSLESTHYPVEDSRREYSTPSHTRTPSPRYEPVPSYFPPSSPVFSQASHQRLPSLSYPMELLPTGPGPNTQPMAHASTAHDRNSSPPSHRFHVNIDTPRLSNIQYTHRYSFPPLSTTNTAAKYPFQAALSQPAISDPSHDITLPPIRSIPLPTPSPSPGPGPAPLIPSRGLLRDVYRRGSHPLAEQCTSDLRHAADEPRQPRTAEPGVRQITQGAVRKCAVSSLLNVEREVWAPRGIKSSPVM